MAWSRDVLGGVGKESLVSTARNHLSPPRLRRLGQRDASPSSRAPRHRIRAAFLAPALLASIGAGLAAAQPAGAAVSAPRFLSAVVPCQSAVDPAVLRSMASAQYPAHSDDSSDHVSSGHVSSALARPCWARAH